MSKTFRVIWAETAENDLINIVEFIVRDSPSDPCFAWVPRLKILQKIKKKTDSLFHFPQRGRIIPELREQGISQYRELVISPWRVIYRISGGKVYVLSVLDSRQNVEDILLKRFIKK